MSKIPRIDTPCPLDAQTQGAIDGECAHCERIVHPLDRLTDEARMALFASAPGPICVSYRVPATHRVGRIGAAIAATLITVSAYANDPAPKQADRPTATTGTRIPDQTLREMDEVTVIGAVTDTQDTSAPEDTSAPALPVRPIHAGTAPRQRTTGSRIPDQAVRDMDEVMVIGAVNDPQDATVPEDLSVPALPVRDVQTALSQVAPEEISEEELEVMVMGGVSDPGNVDWMTLETSTPELPVVSGSTLRSQR